MPENKSHLGKFWKRNRTTTDNNNNTNNNIKNNTNNTNRRRRRSKWDIHINKSASKNDVNQNQNQDININNDIDELNEYKKNIEKDINNVKDFIEEYIRDSENDFYDSDDEDSDSEDDDNEENEKSNDPDIEYFNTNQILYIHELLNVDTYNNQNNNNINNKNNHLNLNKLRKKRKNISKLNDINSLDNDIKLNNDIQNDIQNNNNNNTNKIDKKKICFLVLVGSLRKLNNLTLYIVKKQTVRIHKVKRQSLLTFDTSKSHLAGARNTKYGLEIKYSWLLKDLNILDIGPGGDFYITIEDENYIFQAITSEEREEISWVLLECSEQFCGISPKTSMNIMELNITGATLGFLKNNLELKKFIESYAKKMKIKGDYQMDSMFLLTDGFDNNDNNNELTDEDPTEKLLRELHLNRLPPSEVEKNLNNKLNTIEYEIIESLLYWELASDENSFKQETSSLLTVLNSLDKELYNMELWMSEKGNSLDIFESHISEVEKGNKKFNTEWSNNQQLCEFLSHLLGDISLNLDEEEALLNPKKILLNEINILKNNINESINELNNNNINNLPFHSKISHNNNNNNLNNIIHKISEAAGELYTKLEISQSNEYNRYANNITSIRTQQNHLEYIREQFLNNINELLIELFNILSILNIEHLLEDDETDMLIKVQRIIHDNFIKFEPIYEVIYYMGNRDYFYNIFKLYSNIMEENFFTPNLTLIIKNFVSRIKSSGEICSLSNMPLSHIIGHADSEITKKLDRPTFWEDKKSSSSKSKMVISVALSKSLSHVIPLISNEEILLNGIFNRIIIDDDEDDDDENNNIQQNDNNNNEKKNDDNNKNTDQIINKYKKKKWFQKKLKIMKHNNNKNNDNKNINIDEENKYSNLTKSNFIKEMIKNFISKEFFCLDKRLNKLLDKIDNRSDSFHLIHMLVSIHDLISSYPNDSSIIPDFLVPLEGRLTYEFNVFIQNQVNWINSQHVDIKQAGVLQPFSKFPSFVERLEVAADSRDLDITRGAYQKLCFSLFLWLENMSKTNEKYEDIVKLENYFFFFQKLQSNNIPGLIDKINESKHLFRESVSKYLNWMIGYEFENLVKIFQKIEGLVERVGTNDVKIHVNRNEIQKIMHTYSDSRMHEGIKHLHKRMDKHLCRECSLLPILWKKLGDLFFTVWCRYEELTHLCYNIDLLPTSETLKKYMSELDQLQSTKKK